MSELGWKRAQNVWILIRRLSFLREPVKDAFSVSRATGVSHALTLSNCIDYLRLLLQHLVNLINSVFDTKNRTVLEYRRYFLLLCWRKLSTSCSPRVRDSGFRKIFAFGIRNLGKFYTWNLESWALELGIQHKESGIPLTIGIHNPSSTYKDWNQVPGIRNPLCGIQNPRLSWIPLYEAILYRAFSVTCPAATQIYWNKKTTFLHN